MAAIRERVFVWLGGVMFVASLAFCAYSYLVHWSGGREPLVHVAFGLAEPGPPAAIFDAILVSLFAAHHSVFARERVKQALAQALPERLVRTVYVWTASLLLLIVCALWQPIGGDAYQVTGWRAMIHLALQASGVWLIAQSVRVIDALELAGIRRRPATGDLQMAGPYRLVRHPLYLGWMLATFAAAHMTIDRLAFAVLTTAYLVVAIPWEERALIAVFGREYQAYQRRVRWRVLPYVY